VPDDPSTALAGYGVVEAKVRDDVAAILTAHPMGEALAEGAYFLARMLDRGVEDKVAAGIWREVRMTLAELARFKVGSDGEFESDLSTPVRDTEES
jgi:hypothetical protein